MTEQLKEIQNKYHLSQNELARKIDISSGYMSRIMMGEAVPSRKVREAIIRVFHVSRSWLESGEGEMFEQDTPSSDAALLALKKELLELVDRMNEEQASHALSYLKFLLCGSDEK